MYIIIKLRPVPFTVGRREWTLHKTQAILLVNFMYHYYYYYYYYYYYCYCYCYCYYYYYYYYCCW